MTKKYVLILTGIFTMIVGAAMFVIGVSLFAYQGPPLRPFVSEAGKYSFFLWLPTFAVGVTIVIIGARMKKPEITTDL